MTSVIERNCSRCKQLFHPTSPSIYHCKPCKNLFAADWRFRKTGKAPVPKNEWIDGLKECERCHVMKRPADYKTMRYRKCISCQKEEIKEKASTPESRAKTNKLFAERNKTPKGKKISANQHLKSRYGLTLEEKQAMLESQGGKCAICGTQTPKTWWAVDHCHTSGKIRGVLCHCCNAMLGMGQDNPSALLGGVHYLIRNHLNNGPGTVTIGVPRPDDERDEDEEWS